MMGFAATLDDGEGSATTRRKMSGTGDDTDSDGPDDGGDFKPVEHPVEPSDCDLPVKCPELEALFFADEQIWKEEDMLCRGGSRKREEEEEEEAPVENEKNRGVGGGGGGQHFSTDGMNKRHQSNRGKQSSNIFQIFNQCKLEV